MSVFIDGVEYIKKQSLEGKKKMIVICDNRGLTMVGDVDLNADGEWITIENAQCIIRWGTTKHLAELVNGRTGKTILGDKQDFICRKTNVIGAYFCGDGWNE